MIRHRSASALRAAAGLLAATMLMGCFPLTAGTPEERGWLRVEFIGENHIESLPSLIRKDVLYVRAKSLADILGNKAHYVAENHKLVITVGTQSVKITGANPSLSKLCRDRRR